MAFDKDLALAQFNKRVKENEGKQIDNSRLRAGSPMHYCKFCGAHTETLPEDHIKIPVTTCEPCAPLRTHGLI